MILKKSNKADLEKKRVLFLQAGFIIAISLVMAAFEWSSPGLGEARDLYGMYDGDDGSFEKPPVTIEEKTKVNKSPKFLQELKVVPTDVLVDEDFDFVSEDMIIDLIDKYQIRNEEEKNSDDIIFYDCSEQPKFQGGDKNKFRTYVCDHLVFPNDLEGIQGRVEVRFLVNKSGKVTNIEIVQCTHPVFSDAVVKVLENSPVWTPGKQAGKPVNILMSMKFRFEIHN